MPLIERHFTKDLEGSVFDTVAWEKRKATLENAKGEILFEQEIEAPSCWSHRASNIVAQKYFYGDSAKGTDPSTGGREHSVRQLIHRVCHAISQASIKQGLLDPEEAEILYDELAWLCLHQYGSFNSPIWFNVGLHEQYGIKGDNSNRIYGVEVLKEKIFSETLGNYEISYLTQVEKVDPYERPQASACFILSLEDSIEDIWRLMADSARLFKYGSGVGTDWSKLRSSKEKLSGGGTPSGPVSFMKVQDTTGGTIKSGGKTRRAAIMQTLRVWHPDIELFVEAKQKEERKAWALIEAGYDGSYNGDAYGSVAFQNVNQSVRVTDEFMRKASEGHHNYMGAAFKLRSPVAGEVLGEVYADDLIRKIAEGTWICGDPGVQYEDTIQRWHTVKNSGPINSSNPCSEYLHIDDSACNLSSLNLKKFWNGEHFDTQGFRSATRTFLTAMEVLVDYAGYPTEKVAQNSHDYRPLGLGFTNLGALLMSMGLPYDSKEARSVAGGIMALEHGEANLQSTRIAERVGPFTYWEENRKPFLEVLTMHKTEAALGDVVYCSELDLTGEADITLGDIWSAANKANHQALENAKHYGIRNSQVTVLAPTGTISFMMDADTTGIEPELALVKTKLLAGKGDGCITMVNHTVEEALVRLGYRDDSPSDTLQQILNHIEEKGTAAGAPGLLDKDLPVFATSFGSENTIPWQAHLKMMAACQPFVSGAISKTINMPESSTVEDIVDAYVMGWDLGLKAVAIYRENSKRSQPLSAKITAKEEQPGIFQDARKALDWKQSHPPSTYELSEGHLSKDRPEDFPIIEEVLRRYGNTAPMRRHLPDERESITHKFSIAGHEGYLTVGLYPESGMPGEIFVTMAKEGSTVSGMMDAFATMVSIGLQYGVPLEKVVDKFKNMRFEPSGFTHSREVPVAKSILDYIARWLEHKFLPEREARKEDPPPSYEHTEAGAAGFEGPPCPNCQALTMPSGACYVCPECGTTTGCG